MREHRNKRPLLGRAVSTVFIGLAVASILAPTSVPDAAQPEAASIGVLSSDELQSLPYACECEFFRGPINGGSTVFATREHRKIGLARIEGRLVKLHRDGKEALSSCHPDRSYRERWIGGPTILVLDLHATGPGEESCWYGGTISVTVARRKGVISVSGACGC